MAGLNALRIPPPRGTNALLTPPESVLLYGSHGVRYRFHIPLSRHILPLTGGVYTFLHEGTLIGGPQPLYIGETDSFRERLTPCHEKWALAEARGFRFIGILPVYGGEALRLEIERDLIEVNCPVLNLK